MTSLLHPDVLQIIDGWVAKFPPGRQQSAVLQSLMAVQNHYGHLTPERMDAVADYLGIPRVAVYEVATFYTLFDLKPVGRHKISLCTNVSCMLRGSDELVQHLASRWGLRAGETTPDGRFTLKAVECMAACGGAPMMEIHGTYYEHLTPEKMDAILEGLE